MGLLRALSGDGRTQQVLHVVLTTHSPYLLDLVDLETDQVLVFRHEKDGSRTAQPVERERLRAFLDEFLLGEVWLNEGEQGLVARSA
jgi:hypothetical protein